MKFQFENLAEFMAMNGHGPYVWAAYSITALALIYLLVNPVLQQKAFFKQQRKIQQKTAANISPTSADSQ